MHIHTTQNDEFLLVFIILLEGHSLSVPNVSAASCVLSPLRFLPSGSAPVFSAFILQWENWGSVRLVKWLKSIEIVSDDTVIYAEVFESVFQLVSVTLGSSEKHLFSVTLRPFPLPPDSISQYINEFPHLSIS